MRFTGKKTSRGPIITALISCDKYLHNAVFDFLIDTGADNTSISLLSFLTRMEEDASLEDLPIEKVSGVGGSQECHHLIAKQQNCIFYQKKENLHLSKK